MLDRVRLVARRFTLDHLDEERAAGRSALMVVVVEADTNSVVGALNNYIRIDRQPVRLES